MLSIDFTQFWQGLSALSKFYWIIALPASAIFAVQLIMLIIGGDADHDAPDHGDGDFGSHFISFKSIVSFFTLFGWTGVAATYADMSVIISLVISLVSGLVMMVLVGVLFYYMSKLTYSGTLDMQNAIGCVGDVYLTVPPKKQGVGKVQVKVQGTLRTLDAMTEDPEPIRPNSIIEVVEIINDNILLIKRSR